ncbi:DUF4345 domain-containing protein [Cytophaga hutchinsonii]|jgi:hypothetical protein|nr:DUF4345 domain-containing protein [Cytophaga hutchinsonii]SFX94780.1 protein of unknown function [Cytophaga hutchinsonii ATCC 33406]
MKTTILLPLASKGFILFSALSLLTLSILAFNDPQAVMDLVQVNLPNTDAYSSIRGVYGGVGLTICISLLYLLRRDVQLGLAFLSLLWGLYALSRIITIQIEGSLGNFGSQWLVIESVLFVIGFTLYLLNKIHTRNA